MAKTTLLVFAIIALVAGACSLGWGLFMLIITMSLIAQFPGTEFSEEGLVTIFTFSGIGIGLIVVSIILFIVRAKKG